MNMKQQKKKPMKAYIQLEFSFLFMYTLFMIFFIKQLHKFYFERNHSSIMDTEITCKF